MNNRVIYKYRNWKEDYHKTILTRNELFLALPIEINDPFDFRISIDLGLLDSAEKKEKFIDDLLQDATPVLSLRGINIEDKRNELLLRLNNNPKSIQNEYESTEIGMSIRRFGIISFSCKWNSILLWSHYARNHQGFCVGFNLEKLQNSNLFGAYGPVIYRDTYPSIDPLERNELKNIVRRSHTKSKEWEYESEYRFVNIFDEPDVPPNQRVVKYPVDFIEEVILGLDIPYNDKDEIISICKVLKIPVYQIIRTPQTFLLDRELLNIA